MPITAQQLKVFMRELRARTDAARSLPPLVALARRDELDALQLNLIDAMLEFQLRTRIMLEDHVSGLWTEQAIDLAA